jgi:hypothetical protein
MKLKKEELEHFITLQAELAAFYEAGCISISPHSNTIQLTATMFLETFENYTVEVIERQLFPIILSTHVGDVKFFALCTVDEFIATEGPDAE